MNEENKDVQCDYTVDEPQEEINVNHLKTSMIKSVKEYFDLLSRQRKTLEIIQNQIEDAIVKGEKPPRDLLNVMSLMQTFISETSNVFIQQLRGNEIKLLLECNTNGDYLPRNSREAKMLREMREVDELFPCGNKEPDEKSQRKLKYMLDKIDSINDE